MIITYQMTGQLSNNLIEYIHYDAYCRENHQSYYNPDFLLKHSSKYPKIKPLKNRFYFYPLWLLTQIIRLRIAGFQPFGLIFTIVNFHEPEDLYKIKYLKNKKGLIFVRGFGFRQNESVLKHKKTYQDLFEPNINKEEIYNKYFIDKVDYVYLGVHIRRGDYKRFLGGKYFYDDGQYIKWIKEFIELQYKPVRIIIFTNDKNLDKKQYNEFDVKISNQNPIEDHFLMAQCDFIIGPPSTFSIWASFMGGKPVCYLHEQNQEIKMEKFKVQNSH